LKRKEELGDDEDGERDEEDPDFLDLEPYENLDIF